MEGCSHVGLRECKELLAEVGKFPPCLQEVCTVKICVNK